MYYAKPGGDIYFADDFEAHEVHKGIEHQPATRGGKWQVSTGDPQSYYVDNNTSFGEGFKCLHARGGAELVAVGNRPLDLSGTATVTVDLDVFIRSDSAYPNIMPNPLTKSRHQTAISLKAAGQDTPLIGARAAAGAWQYWDKNTYVDSEVKIAYDVWNHLQMALDTATGMYQVVVQPVGEMPILAAKGTWAGKPAAEVHFVISPSHTEGHSSLYDNILIASRPD